MDSKSDMLTFIQKEVEKNNYFVLDVTRFSICVVGQNKEKAERVVFAPLRHKDFGFIANKDIIMLKNYQDN